MVMIEYDYEIVRDEKNETKVFKPDKIPTILPNLVNIQAPNSSGKSTLLNLIALSFYGNKNKKLHPSLLKKINSLLDSNHQNIIFKIKVTNANSTIEIISEKKDADKIDIIVHEISDGKKIVLTPELFDRKYNLIYDIPDNPTERLNKLTYEVKDAQIRYGNRVGLLNAHIKKIISDIRSSRNPERLKQFKLQFSNLSDVIHDLDNLIVSFESELETLELATYHYYYTHYSTRYDLKEKELKKEERRIKKMVKDENKSDSKYLEKTIALNETVHRIQKTFEELTVLLKQLIPQSETHHLEIWERVDISQTFDDLEFDDNLLEEIVNFNGVLNELHDDVSNKPAFQETKLCNDLIQVLHNYKTINLTIPGLEKTITEFVNDLEKIVRLNEKTTIFDENCIITIGLLDNLRQDIKFAQRSLFPNLRLLRDTHSNDTTNVEYDLMESKIGEIKEILSKYGGSVKYYEAELLKKEDFDPDNICKIGEDELEKYSVYTEEQLHKEIVALKEEISNKKTELSKNKFTLDRLSTEIKDIEKKKPHEYQNNLDELEQLESITTILSIKLLNQFNGYISAIIDGKVHSYENINEEQKNYYKFIFSYLGTVLGTVHHLDKTYEVKCIDLVKEKIITEDGKTIMFTDMGTGQSQSAYLMSLLNNSDDRKIIALFDEIAMMDKSSLEPIYGKIRELYEQNKLLLGIVVQKSDQKVNITPI